MKILTLAAVAVVALLGFFIVGCDESQTMMEQVTRETSPAPEEEVTVKETQPTPEEEVPVEETPPASDEETIATTFPSRRGEVTLAETSCATDFCLVGISYTNDANTDGSGQLTLYFDIPDALGPGPHRVVVIHRREFLQTDIPLDNKQLVPRVDATGNVHAPYAWYDYTEATLFLDADDKIAFKSQFPPGFDSVQILLGDGISGDAPGAVPMGDPPIDPDWDGEGQYYERSFELHSAAPPVEEAPRVLRGEELVRATVCKEGACFVGISYTNEWKPDNTGKLTLYFDIPDALGAGPHRVVVRYYQKFMQTDIPFENKQVFPAKDEQPVHSYHEGMWDPYTESILFLDSDDKIVFNYRIALGSEEAALVIGDAISDYVPGAVPVGDPNQEILGWDNGELYAEYPYWEGEEELYNELVVRIVGGIRLDLYGH